MLKESLATKYNSFSSGMLPNVKKTWGYLNLVKIAYFVSVYGVEMRPNEDLKGRCWQLRRDVRASLSDCPLLGSAKLYRKSCASYTQRLAHYFIVGKVILVILRCSCETYGFAQT